MMFSSIPGLKEVKAMLIDSVKSNHNAHAQLFLGKEGALNLPLALAYTTFLHCQNKGDTDACGICAACSKSLKFIHPDTNFVFPLSNIKGDKDADRFKAEMLKSWRQFLIEQPFGKLDDWTNYYGGEDKQAIISREESREIIRSLSLKPFESRFKVMLIWQPEFMHPSAANGILKILEEPPSNTFFFLITNAAERLLPTILSRTQIIQVPLLSDPEVNEFLENKRDLEETRRRKIVQQAEGDLNFALNLIDQEEDNNQEIFTDWMRSCFKKDYARLLGLSDNFHELDKMSQRNLLHYGQSMMRETLLHRAGATEINRATGNELKFIQDFSKVMTTSKIERTNHLMNEAAYHLERNGSAKMIFMDLSLQLSAVIK
ncbi:MAG: DNA polymerase III subunit [Bacteroidia bacterium]|nr:DNA polymerase III subunit [Bacteroidia bacterium]